MKGGAFAQRNSHCLFLVSLGGGHRGTRAANQVAARHEVAADGAIITDFKTAARGGELLEISHELQLSCYSYLFRQTSPLPEEALEIRSLVKTKVPRVENHRYEARSAAHYLRLFSVIRAYLDALDAGNYYIRPSHLCAACEFSSSRCAQWTC